VIIICGMQVEILILHSERLASEAVGVVEEVVVVVVLEVVVGVMLVVVFCQCWRSPGPRTKSGPQHPSTRSLKIGIR
jgi:hypothetical protein